MIMEKWWRVKKYSFRIYGCEPDGNHACFGADILAEA